MKGVNGQGDKGPEGMASLKDKIENALNESGTLVLGVEVLVGFEYSAYFQSTFGKLLEQAQWMKVISLGLMLLALDLRSSWRLALQAISS